MTKNKHDTKSNLAKLLATENISVQHKKVDTAYFDVKNRILCLPIWKEEMPDDVYVDIEDPYENLEQRARHSKSWEYSKKGGKKSKRRRR